MEFKGSTEYGVFYGKVKATEDLNHGLARAFDKELRIRIVMAANKAKGKPVCRPVATILCKDDIQLPDFSLVKDKP